MPFPYILLQVAKQEQIEYDHLAIWKDENQLFLDLGLKLFDLIRAPTTQQQLLSQVVHLESFSNKIVYPCL